MASQIANMEYATPEASTAGGLNKKMSGTDYFIHDLIHLFCKCIPSQHAAINQALEMLGTTHPNRDIILMTESLNFGALPTMLGVPSGHGIRPRGYIATGLNPITLASVDHPPFGGGQLPPPDAGWPSPEASGRRKGNKRANERQRQHFAPAQAAFVQELVRAGVERPPDVFLLDALYRLADRFVQMCPPSAEYPRSDAPETLRFAGGYPDSVRGRRLLDSRSSPAGNEVRPRPAWYVHEDMGPTNTAEKKKKVVFVCQGTVSTDLNRLVLPALAAFRDRADDVFLVVSLGKKGAALPAHVSVPPNARVVDYIPYDDVLPLCACFVTTGGYGSFQRALNHGVPLVMAATTEEKPESAARAEWAGVAVNLRMDYPSVDQLRQAVDRVLLDQKYRNRALEVKDEVASYDPVGVIIENIEEIAPSRFTSML